MELRQGTPIRFVVLLGAFFAAWLAPSLAHADDGQLQLPATAVTQAVADPAQAAPAVGTVAETAATTVAAPAQPAAATATVAKAAEPVATVAAQVQSATAPVTKAAEPVATSVAKAPSAHGADVATPVTHAVPSHVARAVERLSRAVTHADQVARPRVPVASAAERPQLPVMSASSPRAAEGVSAGGGGSAAPATRPAAGVLGVSAVRLGGEVRQPDSTALVSRPGPSTAESAAPTSRPAKRTPDRPPPQLPGGLVGSAASADSGGAGPGVLLAALLAFFFLAIPSVGRWLRPTLALGWSPVTASPAERPG